MRIFSHRVSAPAVLPPRQARKAARADLQLNGSWPKIRGVVSDALLGLGKSCEAVPGKLPLHIAGFFHQQSARISAHTDRWRPHYRLGQVRSKLGDHRRAFSAYAALLRSRPLWIKIHLHAAASLAAAGHPIWAASFLEKAAALSPNNLRTLEAVHSELGLLSCKLSDERGHGLARLQGALHSQILSLRSEVSALSDRRTIAKPRLASNKKRVDRKESLYAFRKGFTFEKSGATNTAVQCYRRALMFDPSLGPAHCRLSILLHRSGRRLEAIESMRRAVALQPSKFSWQKLLQNIESAALQAPQRGRLEPPQRNKIYLRGSEIKNLSDPLFAGISTIRAKDIMPSVGQARVLVVCDSPGGAQYIEEDIGAFCSLSCFSLGVTTLLDNRPPSEKGSAPTPLWEAGMTYNDKTDRAIAEETMLIARQITDVFLGHVPISDHKEICKILASAMALALGDAMYLMARAAVAFKGLLREGQFTSVIIVAENSVTAPRLAPIISECVNSGLDPWLLVAQKNAKKRQRLTEVISAPDFLNPASENPRNHVPEEVARDYRACSSKILNITPLEPHATGKARRFSVLVSPSDGNYSATGCAIVRTLATHGRVDCYLLHSARVKSEEFEGMLADLIDAGTVCLTNLSHRSFSFPNADSLSAHTTFASSFLASMRHQMELKVADANVYSFVRHNMAAVIARTFPFLVQQLGLLLSDLTELKPDAVVACPGRSPLSHLLILSARMLSIPTIDVQAFFQSSHPRYVASPAETFAMIDRSQISIYSSRFSHLGQDCIPVGSVMIHRGITRLRSFDRATERVNLAVQPHERLILFATQHGLGVTNEISLAALLEILQPVSGIRLAIKCHPREPMTAHHRYNQILSAAGASAWCTVIPNGDIYRMIAAADIVITQFSNVGLEAAVAQKNVLALNLQNREYPINLADMGICVGVTSKENLRAVLVDFLRNNGSANQLTKRQEEYRRANSELWEGDPAQRIADLVLRKSAMRNSSTF